MIVGVVACTRLGYDPHQTFKTVYDTMMLVVIYVILAVPFFFAGLAIGLLLSMFARQISTLYFSDLVGAGAGALGVVVLLNTIGAPAAVLTAGLLAQTSRVLFLGTFRRPAGWLGAVAFAVLLVLVVAFDPVSVPVPASKPLSGQEDKIALTRWSLLARVDVMASESKALTFGMGVAKRHFGRRAEYRTFFMDGTNPSRLIKHDQELWFLPVLLSASPYSVAPRNPKVLIIGSGGGIDVLVARRYGAKHVTAVEINPVTVELVSKDFAPYIGGIFNEPDVSLLAKEGRHFLTMDRNRYDVIRLTGVDPRAASAVGANALDHAHLYTVEAIRDLFGHLTEDGVLAISRPSGWPSRRLLWVVITSLEQMGMENLEARVALANNGRWTDVLVRRRPFQAQETEALQAWADHGGLRVESDALGGRGIVRVNARMSAEEREDLWHKSDFNLRPVTDDSPFFFEPTHLPSFVAGLFGAGVAPSSARRSRGPRSAYSTLFLALALALTLSVLFIVVPLSTLRASPIRPAGWGFSLAYFCLLGLGFILAELAFIHKYMIFLGGPTYALSITLFSILVFGGLGAYRSRRVDSTDRVSVCTLLVAVAVLLLLESLFAKHALPALLGLDFPLRIGVSVAALAPVAFGMGMPFPVGIRAIEGRAPGLVAWA